MAKKKEATKENEQLQEVVSTTGQWIEEHNVMLTAIVVAVIAVVFGVICLNKYLIQPKGMEAATEVGKTVVYFNQGDWQKALDGDDAECMGFVAIADDYGLYKQGKLAALYAGICYYKLGEYDEAAKYLKKYKGKDLMVEPAALQLLGDAYVQADELSKAAKAFRKAANTENELIAPLSLKKLGLVYLELDDRKGALKAFETIKNQYPQSSEAQDIDKYIELAR